MTILKTRTLMTLQAETAADLMIENPVSIRDDASVQDAIALFTNKGISAAPVIDAAGRPVGVLSRTDVIIQERIKHEWPRLIAGSVQAQSTDEDAMRVGELMTPAVYSVSPSVPAARVIREMLATNVHRLFVVDAEGTLVGVISAIDVLRHLTD